ncbi:MAG: GNAT family N-acetyltransferase [Magnetospiraceae bacterium]
MTLIPRPATERDALGLSELYGRAFGTLLAQDYAPDLLTACLPLLCRANRALYKSGQYHVVEDPQTGRLIAAGGWTWERPGSGARQPGIAHIRHFATDPSHLQRGHGRLIFNACQAQAKAPVFECYSTLTAAPFYQSVGFQEIGPIKIPLAPGLLFPSVHLRSGG